ncbi:DNA polymerase II [Methanobrevibacter cuticularis]|uniref:DNA polymerase n=1 Tax=Methanobrevibacter cuticularis TaxID=47311 RepID=A0A166FH32_9EURY|nr:DNA-directed DNA polymerase [Methanobrevibacter cuticularis]KZX17664.1 DNA polymerase II [Methanobrevibacter cuticularis]
METRNIILLDIDYVTQENKAVIRLFGKEKEEKEEKSEEEKEEELGEKEEKSEEEKEEELGKKEKNQEELGKKEEKEGELGEKQNRVATKENFSGKEIIALDDSFEPYIYAVPNDIEIAQKEIRELGLENIEVVRKKKFQVESEFLKITFSHPQEVPKLREEIKHLDSVDDIHEHDIPFYRRYLIDNNIFPMSEIEISGEIIDSYPTIKPKSESTEIMKLANPPKTLDNRLSKSPEVNILSFDLEVRNPKGMPNAKRDEIIMIGVSSNFGLNKVISTKGKSSIDLDDSEIKLALSNSDGLDFVETVESEKEMIKTFVKTVKNHNIDIIVGYNSDNFDFPYLKDRAKLLNVDLDLGMDGSGLKFLKRGYSSAASFKGLIHVDLYLVMRRYLSLDRYTLERVYLELFGEEKIDVPGDRIWEFWDSNGRDLVKLFNYSLDDVISTLKIAEKILPLNLELTRIVGQPFFDLTRMATGQQAEWFLVRKAFEYDELVPNKPLGVQKSSKKVDITGGYVKEPETGLHENLVQFDFRSLYPSIIISKNISPDVLLRKSFDVDHNIANYNNANKELNDDDYFISPEYSDKFAKSPQGFIPSVIGEVLNERFRIKKEMKDAKNKDEMKILDVQQSALKRLANTMYGIYGFSRFRWYSIECAESITAWGREYIKDTIKKAEKHGFYAIYADTDGFYAKFLK